MSPFADAIYKSKYSWKDADGVPQESWEDTAERVVKNVLGAIGLTAGQSEYIRLLRYVKERKFMPGGRYLYASGRDLHQVNNCLLLQAEDSREGWADLMRKSGMALMTGAGIGVDYSKIRASGEAIAKTGGEASGPISLMTIVNEIGRNVMQGGSRRSAIWAGLNWAHNDIDRFVRLKNWEPEVRALKEKDFNFPATLDMTNISVLLDDEFFAAYDSPAHPLHERAHAVYWDTVERMLKTAEPGFSVDIGKNAGETLRNACTELTSYDTDDICNLGSINLARIHNEQEFADVVLLGTLFLLAGTVYSDVPYDEVDAVRTKNRRLGLGLMGVHEWLLRRGKQYGPDSELERWMQIYATSTTTAQMYANKYGLTPPVKTRAIAPTGTIAILAETTTGIEPVFCSAFKRRYKTAKADGADEIRYQYVIDPTVRRLVDMNIDPSLIEDAYTLSEDVERRIGFQAWMQRFVDHGISSTINLPGAITDPHEVRAFGEMLYRYLPFLRGITVYPDGARGGQPLTAVPYAVAASNEGVVFEESDDKCSGGVCGI